MANGNSHKIWTAIIKRKYVYESDCYYIESYFLTTPARAFEGLWWAFLFFFLTGCIGTIYNCDLRRSFREVMDERGASPFIPSADEMLYAALLAVVMKRVFARGGLIQPQTWITNEQHLAQRVWNLLRVYISSIKRIDNKSTLWCTNYTWCLFILFDFSSGFIWNESLSTLERFLNHIVRTEMEMMTCWSRTSYITHYIIHQIF
jgi:hypothetical protein